MQLRDADLASVAVLHVTTSYAPSQWPFWPVMSPDLDACLLFKLQSQGAVVQPNLDAPAVRQASRVRQRGVCLNSRYVRAVCTAKWNTGIGGT